MKLMIDNDIIVYSVREEALSKLIRLLSQKYIADLLESRKDTMFTLLMRSIKKDKSYNENKLAAKGFFIFIYIYLMLWYQIFFLFIHFFD